MATARIYLRNSSDKQAKAATIEAQRPECRSLVQQLGLAEVVEYPEPAVSGAATLDERPRMRELLRDLRPDDVVVSFALDRVSRSDDLIEQAAVYGAVQRAGATVVTVLDGSVDLSSMVGRIMLAVRSEYNAEERRKFKRRTAAGKQRAASLGRKPQGATPYGLHWSLDTKTWSIDERRGAVVRDIFARLIDGQTCAKIADAFTAARHPVPRSKSGCWTARMVWQLATRPTYRGEWKWGSVTIDVPAIVDAVTWRAAQARMLESNRRGLRRTQHVYLLDEGTGRCDVCARPLQVRWGGRTGQTSYYVCTSKPCALRWRRTADADAEVWRRMVEALRQPDLVARALAGTTEASADATRAEEEAVGYERKLGRLSAVRTAVLAQHRKGHITDEEMDRELATIARERALLEQSAADARTSAGRARVDAATAQTLRDAVRTMVAELERSTPQERREELRLLRPTIRISDDNIRIHFRMRMPLAAPIALVHGSRCNTENHCETSSTDGGSVEIAISA